MTTPDTAPLPGWRCECCQRPMIAQGRFNADPDAWRARGILRHAAQELCNSCYHRRRRGHDTPANPVRSARDIEHAISEWRRLLAAGEPLAAIAAHLGMTRAALAGLLKRARRDGLIEPSDRAGRLAPDELARLRASVGLPVDGAP